MNVSMNPNGKYARVGDIELPNRKWPSNKITKAPVWCSVDLRDDEFLKKLKESTEDFINSLNKLFVLMH